MGRITFLILAFLFLYCWNSNANNSAYYVLFEVDSKFISFAKENISEKNDHVALIAPSCPNPSQLMATNITSNSATVSWTENGVASKWMVRYGTADFNPQVSGIIVPVNATPNAIITGLASGVNYDFYVKALCGKNLESGWIGPGKITTGCSSFSTIPYTVDFENAVIPDVPVCTVRENLGVGPVEWETTANPGFGFNGHVLSYGWDSVNPGNAWFYTHGVMLTAGTAYQISYRYGNDNSFSNIEKMKVAYGLSPNANQMTSILADHPNISEGDATHKHIIFTPTTSGIYYFGFNAYSDANQYFLYLDDIQVDLAPSCPDPSDLEVSNISQTSADLSWTPGLSENKWDIIYGPTGFDPQSAGTTLTIQNTPSVTLNNVLTPGTRYQFYVKAICGANDESLLVGPADFVSECSFTTLPYSIDFEISETTKLPLCTKVESFGNSNNWEIATNPGIGYSGNVLSYAWNPTDAANAWFYTQGLELVAGLTYQISYKYGNNNTFGTVEKMKVAYGLAPEAAQMTTVLADHPNISNGNATSNILTFTPSASGVFYFGFNAYSQKDQYYLYLDDINIEIFTGYTYSGGAWFPEDPSGIGTSLDDIAVLDGSTSLSDNTDVNNLIINSGATLEIHKTLNLYGDITNNGNLVFVSTDTHNGELGPVPPSSTITGNATVQRYMANSRSYRMTTSSVTTSTSIHANWQEGATSNIHNPNPGYGTHITGSTIDQQNGFDGTATGNPSMFTVDVSTQQFQSISNTDTSVLIAGEPYLLFVRGGRDLSLSNNNSSGETVLRATGQLYTGTHVQNFSNDFVMFGNPYQSTVDLNSVFANSNNVNAYVYVYDPHLGDHGSYVTVNLSTGTNNTGTGLGASAANQYLQPGQGAQALVTGPSPTIIFNETDKVSGQFTLTNRSMVADNMLSVQLFTKENYLNGGSLHDAFTIVFDNSFDNEITTQDAVKPMNFYENLGIDHNGTYLSFEHREIPQNGEIYPLFSNGYKHSDYILKLIVDGLQESSLYLDDHYTGASTHLATGENIYGFIVDPGVSSSIATDRFSIRAAQRLGMDGNNLQSDIRLYPNPVDGTKFHIHAPELDGEQLSVSISDLSGRKIFEHTLECRAHIVTVPLGDSVSSGVYMVTLKHGGKIQTYRLIKE